MKNGKLISARRFEWGINGALQSCFESDCLLWAISEQLFYNSIIYTSGAFVSINFESYVEGSLKTCLEQLGDPKENAGQLELIPFSDL